MHNFLLTVASDGVAGTVANAAQISVRGCCAAFLFLLAPQAIATAVEATHSPIPKRIASLGLCTDQLLLQTAELEQVISVTLLSNDKRSATHLLSQAQADEHGIYLNRGEVEELIPLQPDLVLTSNYTPAPAARLLKRLGYRVEQFASPKSLQQLRQNILRMGKITGNSARTKQQLAQLEHSLQQHELGNSSARMLIYGANSYVNGPNTLSGDLFRRLGWHNAAADAGILDYGQINLEQLATLPLDALIISQFSRDTGFSYGESAITHRLLSKLPISMQATVESRWWLCGTANIRHVLPSLPRPTAVTQP